MIAAFALAATVLLEGAAPPALATTFSAPDPSATRELRTVLEAARGSAGLAKAVVDYPQDGSIVPPDLAAPTWLWHEGPEHADRWLVELAFADGPFRMIVPVEPRTPPSGEIDPRCISPTNKLYVPTPYQASALSWRPERALWSALQKSSVTKPVVATFVGWKRGDPGRPLARGSVTISTSADVVGAPIFYRDVPLMPAATTEGVIKPLDQSAQPLINWRLKDVSRDDSRVLLHDLSTCANCHSFPADGKTLAMDVDGPEGDKGAYALAPIEKKVVIDDSRMITWNAFPGKPPGHLTLGFLARISPDGRYVMATVNERLYVRNFPDYRTTQTFYPTRGILAWYDVATKEIRALPGADDTRFVHCNAVWSPDGATLVFMRAQAKDPYDPARPVAMFAGDPNETPIKYDLYRMPFNGGRGGAPQSIPGASANGMSNSFPKISPDGKWLVWTQARNGMLLRPDGKLWIMPMSGGKPRLMRCNTALMNSWHSFSPNGHWMVFSSKTNTPYTQLFLTHIDEQGNDSPPILVENTQAANRAANIPEFVNIAYDDFQEIVVPAVEHRDHFYRANALADAGKKDEAIGELQKAIEGGDKAWRNYDWKYHDKLSRLLLEQGKTDEAVTHIQKSLELNPLNPAMEANLGYILYGRGNLADARKHLDVAVRLAPRDAKAWLNRASVRLSQGDTEGAIGDFWKVIELEPRNGYAWSARGMAHAMRGELPEARTDLDRALALDVRDVTAWYFRAKVRREQGDLAGAASDLDRAAAVAPAGSSQMRAIEAMRREIAGAARP